MMPIARVQLEDGRIARLEVPEGTTEAQIIQFVQSQDFSRAKNDGNTNDNLPGDVRGRQHYEQPVAGSPRAKRSQKEAVERTTEPTFGQKMFGAAEVAGTVASGILAEPVAGIAGITQALNPMASEGAGARAVEATRKALTYQPRTEQGQEKLAGLAESIAPVTETMQSIEQGTGDIGYELTGSPTVGAFGQMLPTLIGELAGGGVLARGFKAAPTKIKNIIKAAPDGTQSSILKAAQQRNVPVLTSDLFPPESYMGKFAQSLSDKLGPLGSGSKRTKQQAARVEAVQSMADELGIDLDSPFASDVAKSVTKTQAKKMELAGNARNQAITKLEGQPFIAERAAKKIDEIIANEKKLGKTANSTTINELEKFKEELSKPLDFRMQAAQRTQLIKARNTLAKGDDAAPPAALQAVKSALDKDMIAFARKTDRQATRKWLASNRQFAEEMDVSKRTSIKQILEKGDVNPEKVLTMLKGGKPSELNRLYDNLGPNGRTAAKKALIQQALKDSGFFKTDEMPNPNAFATALDKPNFQHAKKVFFRGRDKAEIEGLTRLLNVTRKAQESQQFMRTGEVVQLGGAGGLMVGGAVTSPSVAIPLIASGTAIAKAYESKIFRNMLLKLKNAEPGSVQELKVIEALTPILLSTAQSLKNQEEQPQ